MVLGFVGGMIVGLGGNDAVIFLKLWAGWKAMLLGLVAGVCVLCGPCG